MNLDSLAQAATPSTAQVWVPAAITAVATVLVGYLVYRNARRANRVSDREALSKEQLEWTRQAMAEAKEAKEDARQATSAAKAASVAAADAEKRIGEVSDLAGRLMDWIGRVVRKAQQVDADDGTPADVRELLRVINGGPPEISSDSLRTRG